METVNPNAVSNPGGGIIVDSALSYCKGTTEPLIMDCTITAAFDKTVERCADNPALVVPQQDIAFTYREYQQVVRELALGLLELGIAPGDRVGIWSPNRYEWCLTQFATAQIGAIMVCINPAYRAAELEYALNKVECLALVTAASFKDSDYLAMLQSLAPELANCAPGELQSSKLPHLRTIVRMGEEKTAGMYNFSAIHTDVDAAGLAKLRAVAETLVPDDAINIQFTSGTTGNPKGATLSHRNVLNNGKFVGDGMGLNERDRLCIPVPLYHCFGMVMGNLACITHGSAAVFPGEGFDPAKTLQVVSEQRCTALHGVPTMFIAELEVEGFEQFNLSSLRTGIMAGSPCPVEVMKRVIGKMHMEDVLIAYGQTETSPVNHMTTDTDSLEKRVSSVGRAGPHLEIKLIDEAGNTVAHGQRGELCCRGYSVMQGYWGDPEQTAATIDDQGWLHSGDLAVMDAGGYVDIVGRKKDLVIRGGENIYPREVEECIYAHPQVLDVQVFGIPDDRYGEQLCAWIMTVEGEAVDPEEIRRFCKARITHFKVPTHIRFVTEFPMTVTGKVQKFKMREIMVAEFER